MLPDIARRVQTVAGSVVTFVTGLAVLVTQFTDEVVPELPNGWQDNAVAIGAGVVTALATAAAAVRRVSPVPPSQRGLLPRGLLARSRQS